MPTTRPQLPGLGDDVVFATVHGSHLYGFAHEGSDYDTYTVTTSRSHKTRQVIDDHGNDQVTVGLWHFLDLATSGSHQSVEALYSPVKEWGPAGEKYRPMLTNMVIYGPAVFEKYERTIRKFCYGDQKRRRHAARLACNLDDLRAMGYLRSSRLIPSQIRWCDGMAALVGDDLAWELGVYVEREA